MGKAAQVELGSAWEDRREGSVIKVHEIWDVIDMFSNLIVVMVS